MDAITDFFVLYYLPSISIFGLSYLLYTLLSRNRMNKFRFVSSTGWIWGCAGGCQAFFIVPVCSKFGVAAPICEKFIIFFIILSGIIFALGLHHIAVVDLLESFTIASITTVLVVFGYVKYVEKRDKEVDSSIAYSLRRFILEVLAASALGFLAYLSGLDFMRSAAVGLFIFILTEWYYHMILHKYSFAKIFIALRLSLIFIAMVIGWISLVKAGVEVSFAVALFFTLMVEVDRRGVERLTRFVNEEWKKAMEKRAGVVFQPIGFIYGMVVGVMAVNKIYGIAYFAEWLLEMHRLGYIFVVVLTPFFVLGSWGKVLIEKRLQRQTGK